MILFKIQGGLCNQLFQWAYAYNLSKSHELYIDTSFYGMQFLEPLVTNRDFQLNEILLNPLPLMNNDAYQRFISPQPQRILDSFKACKHNFSANQNYYLEGYWQSEKYFLDLREEILNSFSWPEIKKLNFQDSCSIHVRRGDYLKTQYVHPIQTIDYYNKSLDIIQPKGNIFIFSDDIEWCKENFHFKNSIFMENNTNIQDLRYMSLCENNIIANSSFSWWGAWLNKNENKKVICPKNWFNDQTNDKDMKPKDWIQV
tara:strand:+ start:111 stop:881 length:771 start_codon:yes stop_codon:yes gene_type:complete